MLVFLTVMCGLTLSYGYYFDFDYFARKGSPAPAPPKRVPLPALNFNETFFSSLENYEVNATRVTETKYPWIARVVHSSTTDVPYMCTASCIQERVFITAARCIYTLKVQHTSVIYQNKYQLPALVFVMPSHETKQSYDDIGFIVVQKIDTPITWKVVHLYDKMNRTDDRYEWFQDLPTAGYKAVGYATKRGLHKLISTGIPFNLTELEVHIGLDICAKMLTNNKIKGFHVPCYHSCTVQQFQKPEEFCNKYHGVEGGAIIEIATNKLLGVVTWGYTYNNKYELPSGFSVVNSDNFYKDYECAKAIARDKPVPHSTNLYWQKLCDKLLGVTVTSLSLFVAAKNHINAQRLENMKIRERMRRSNQGEYPDLYRKY